MSGRRKNSPTDELTNSGKKTERETERERESGGWEGWEELQWSRAISNCANWHHNGPLIMAITQQQ